MENFRLLNKEESLEFAQKLWSTKRMQDFLVDKYDFYTTKDGLILELEKVNKICIDKTMYYDDETEPPTVSENNFILYNRYNIPNRDLQEYLKEKESLNTIGCASGRYDYQGIYFRSNFENNDMRATCNWAYDKDKYFERYLTPEEEKEYIEIMEERGNKYIERLKKYFKRYGNHVHTYGYWANR